MKAKRTVPEQEFVPVIVMLESQEEVDSLFVIGNDTRICRVLPALDGVYSSLKPFISPNYCSLNDRLDSLLS